MLPVTLRDAYEHLANERIDLTSGTIQQYRISVGWFERVHGRVPLRDLTPLHVIGVMRAMRDAGRCERTVNNGRKNLLMLWRYAEDQGSPIPPLPNARRIPRMREPAPLAKAWTPEQMGRIIEACGTAPERRGWTPEHWRALILTIYDTSLRIGCLMRSTIDQLDGTTLTVPGSLQKGRRETCQPLHPDTAARLAALPRTDKRLFAWPYRREELWRKFREILKAAGLPATRRDQFHRIRRTSYTMVAVALGKEAASQHAAHRGDLSRFYLDPTFLPKPNPLDALPRPA